MKGKEAFDQQIENDAFLSPPAVETLRTIEQDDVVVAEGTVRVRKDVRRPRAPGVLRRVRDGRGKIRKLISYLMEVKGRAADPSDETLTRPAVPGGGSEVRERGLPQASFARSPRPAR